jgi:hypothetical protein
MRTFQIDSEPKRLYFTTDAKQFINIMYDIGAIGNYRIVHGKRRYTFKYREDGADVPDYRYLFTVHQGLRKSLLRK